MSAGSWIELVIGVSPLVGVPLLVWRDPAGHLERARRELRDGN